MKVYKKSSILLIYGESRTLKEKVYVEPRLPNDFLSFVLLADTLHDLVKTTDLIPSIKTDHAATSLELVNDSDDIKGPGLWKMKINLELIDFITLSPGDVYRANKPNDRSKWPVVRNPPPQKKKTEKRKKKRWLFISREVEPWTIQNNFKIWGRLV